MKRESPINRPIGIFDSGMGGLTVMRAIKEYLPFEDLLYLGDTARVPYGTKSKEIITKFAFQDAEFLISRGVKLIIVACHSVSSIALEDLKKRFNISISGVIEPGAKAAVKATRNGKIGVIGTHATISSGAYERAIRKYRRDVEIIAKPTPLFVPLVEEGWFDNEITYQIALFYLSPLREDGIDTLLLGCTHYPLIKTLLKRIMGEEVKIVDASNETAFEAKELLKTNHLLREEQKPHYKFYLSDLVPNFARIGERFLGNPMDDVIRASIPE